MQAGAGWTKNGKTPTDYLACTQDTDGAAISGSESINNRVWATSYAIPAVLGKSWSAIMHSVPKPQVTQATPSPVPVVEEIKKEDKIVQKTEESKPEEATVEPAPKVVQKTPVMLAVAKESEIIQKPMISKNTEAEKVVEPLGLAATAHESKTTMPMPVIIGSIAGIGVLAFVGRKFLIR
jgi:hypothetical protein